MIRAKRWGVVAMLIAFGISTSTYAQEKKNVKEGDPAPDVKVKVAEPGKAAKEITLKDYQGKKNVVLFYFPKAMTPG